MAGRQGQGGKQQGEFEQQGRRCGAGLKSFVESSAHHRRPGFIGNTQCSLIRGSRGWRALFRSSRLGTVSRRTDPPCPRSARGVARPRPWESISTRVEVGRRRLRDCEAHSGGPARLRRRKVLSWIAKDPHSHGQAIRPRGPSCGACVAPRGPLEMVTRRRTDSSYVHMPHRAFSRLHARSLPSVRPARTPRRPRSGFVLARPQFTVCRRPLTASTDLPRLPSTRRGWIVPRARSC